MTIVPDLALCEMTDEELHAMLGTCERTARAWRTMTSRLRVAVDVLEVSEAWSRKAERVTRELGRRGRSSKLDR